MEFQFNGYNIVKLEKGTLKFIKVLYLRSFGLKTTDYAIHAKYDTLKYAGYELMGFLAMTSNGTPAGYYGVFPMKFKLGEQDVHIAQSGDTMTHPDHQKKGLFIELAKQTYSYLAKRTDIKFVFGFPNMNSLPGFQRKLDWQFFGEMESFEFRVKSLPLAYFSKRIKVFAAAYGAFVQHFLVKKWLLDEQDFIQSFNTGNRYQVKKDRLFFEYKLGLGNTYLLLRKDGFNLFLKIDGALYVGDIGFIVEFDFSLLMLTLRKIARRIGCRNIVFVLGKNHWMYNRIEGGKTSVALPIGFYNIGCEVPLSEISFTLADYDTF